MTVAITSDRRNLELASSLMAALGGLGVGAVGLKFGARWREEPRAKAEAYLSKATHFMHVVDAQSADEAWFAYLVGLARGDGRRQALYRVDPLWTIPPWLAGIPVFDGPEEAEAYYRIEADEWEVAEARRRARADLLELGISWHAESFAHCVAEGDYRAVQMFLDSGYPPDVRDKHGVPMACLAARHRHHGIVELLLDAGASVNAQSDDRAFSPLMDAAQNGDDTLVRYLLDRGADPDLVSKDGQSALVIAVGRADLPVCASLITAGADPDLPDKLGLSARKYAQLFKHADIAALMA